MGDKTIAFVTKASEYCKQNPDLVPPYLDVPELQNDTTSVTALRSIHALHEQITEALSDSMMLAGSDAYVGARMFYNSDIPEKSI